MAWTWTDNEGNILVRDLGLSDRVAKAGDTMEGTLIFDAAPRWTVQAFTATGSISATGGRVVTFTGPASQILTLPVITVAGEEFEIFNTDATDSVTIAAGSGDTVLGVASVTLGAGQSIKVTSTNTTNWAVATSSGGAGEDFAFFMGDG